MLNGIDLLQITLITLRLLKVITWPWYMVLLPLEVSVIIILWYKWAEK